MRTIDARAHRALDASDNHELIPVDLVDAVSDLRPSLDRVRRGEWRLLLFGPRSAQERDAAAMFQSRLLDLADAINGRR